PHDCQRAGQYPCREQPSGAADVARHLRGHDEDSRPDHRSDDHHRRVVEAESACELGIERGRRRRIGHHRLLQLRCYIFLMMPTLSRDDAWTLLTEYTK